ncbi:hypothetical protein JCM8097_007484 [Rhodosporidiobolus ruineniae]
MASAYSALAAELTRTEIKNLGGYSLGRVIGEGSFGKVRLGVHRLTGTRVAVKQVSKSLPGATTSDPSSPLSLLTRELHHHRRLRHPHLLTLYELLATESSIYLITELCAGGELFDYLVEQGRLSLPEARRIFGQLCLGVAYLHGEGVVHRDLKLENVLLDEHVNVKIADLGFARETEKGRWLETRVGTVGYTAPEVLRGSKYLGEEIDIWSLGIIFYALVTGSLPFDDEDEDEDAMRELILKGEYDVPEWLDADAAALIRLILSANPTQRPSIRQILAHPFYTRPSDPPPPPLQHITSRPTSASPPSVGSLDAASAPLRPSMSRSSTSSLISMAAPGAGSAGAPLTTVASIPEDSAVGASGPLASPSSASGPLSAASTAFAVEDFRERGSAEMSEVKAGKRRAIEPDEEEEYEAGRTSPAAKRRPSASSVDFPLPSLAPLSTGSAPAMYRTTSTGGASITSTHSASQPATSHSHGASGTPYLPHARTPSRTKRRSIGSIISVSLSEQLVALDGDSPGFSGAGGTAVSPSTSVSNLPFSSSTALPRVDYVSLLELANVPPLSTAPEKALLDSLAVLGMDAGQVAHSVKTHACDSCAAVWWMLWRKQEEREREREYGEGVEGREGGGGLSRASSLRSLSRAGGGGGGGELARRGSLRGVREDDEVTQHDSVAALVVEDTPILPPPPPIPIRMASLGAPVTPTPRPAGAVEANPFDFRPDEDNFDAAPCRTYFPPSPTKGSKSKGDTGSASSTPPLAGQDSSFPPAPSTPPEGSERRGRASSLVLLNRASGALETLPTSLSPKKKTVTNPPGPPALPTASPAPYPSPSLSSTPRPDPPPSAPSPAPSSSAGGFATLPSSSASSTTRSSRPRPMSLGNNGVGEKKGLLNTFKKLFGADTQRQRLKRASLQPRMASEPSWIGTSGAAPTSTVVGLSRSATYGGFVDRRPSMSSRRSSNQSLSKGRPVVVSPSRRSSASSVHRPQLDLSSAPRRPAHHRRISSDSRSVASEQGELASSRPGSVRRKRVSHAPSTASSISHGTSKQIRPPPTTTVVRRRHGSHGRHGAQHRRTASGTTSASFRSSTSEGAEGSFTDEPLEEGETFRAVEEEDEEEDEDAERQAARADALRALSGGGPAPPSRPSSLTSTTSAPRHRSHHAHPAVFLAHKSQHLYGSPLQPHAPTSSSSSTSHSTRPSHRPPRRDVFTATSRGDDDWEDESDPLDGYGGGLGQNRAGEPEGKSSGAADRGAVPASDSPVASRFTARYSGVPGGPMAARSALNRPAVAVVEEDEEEEE